jgi:site-specific DNA-adenine methylase
VNQSNNAKPATEALSAPFSYYGGKRRVAPLVWAALGDPNLYIEPFFGSGAALLARPDQPRREIVNDIDGFVVNFWRAVQRDPVAVAKAAARPVYELDLCAWHRHLCAVGRKRRLLQRVAEDPKYSDAAIAGIWCWGLSIWIGGGFCAGEWHGPGDARNRGTGLVEHKKPRLKPDGIVAVTRRNRVREIMEHLAHRLRHAVVVCGDWRRCFMPSDLKGRSDVGIFLDPPYAHTTGRDTKIYRHEKADTSDVESFCEQYGHKRHVRIVLAGF